jgi:hypothetical protein
MPDLHPGNTYPVGAVFCSLSRIYPYLIGSDIGWSVFLLVFGFLNFVTPHFLYSGMSFLATDMRADKRMFVFRLFFSILCISMFGFII